jgi:hypothetical protein
LIGDDGDVETDGCRKEGTREYYKYKYSM